MRGGTAVFGYILGLFLFMERLNNTKVCVLLVLLLATALTICGASSFSLAGFALQGAAMLCESVRGSLQALLLSRNGWRLDALTYVLLVMPVCMVLLTCICAAKDIFGLEMVARVPKHLD